MVTAILQAWEESRLSDLAQASEETQTQGSNIPSKFANHQVVGKAGASHVANGSASLVSGVGLLGDSVTETLL